MVAIHFEAQKGKFPNLVFSKITKKAWFFTNYDQIPKRPWDSLHQETLWRAGIGIYVTQRRYVFKPIT